MPTRPDPVTLTKDAFDRFWDEALGKDWYIQEWDIDDVDFDRASTHTPFTVGYLSLGWQGGDKDPEPTKYLTNRDLESYVDGMVILNRWMKDQTATTVVADVPLDKLDEVIAAITNAGGTVMTPEPAS